MTRRGLLAVALVFGSMIPGCGMATRRLDEQSLAEATTAVHTFDAPPHRVALATFEAMRAELATVDFAKDSEFAPVRPPKRPDGTTPKEGELPPDLPAFWLEWSAAGKPERALVRLTGAHFVGKAKDGRPIEVNVTDHEGVIQATIRVDKLGDRRFSIYLFSKIDDRLNHPSYPPGSAEEAAALQAFFGGVASREALPSLHKPADQAPAGSVNEAASRSR
jgi:hypothetical protein